MDLSNILLSRDLALALNRVYFAEHNDKNLSCISEFKIGKKCSKRLHLAII
jgi:hypothetical protein